MFEGRHFEMNQQRLIRVKNASGETIPACAAMRITGLDADDKSLRTVDKPNADSQTDLIIFNGPTEIAVPVTNDENEESGHGQGFADFPVLTLCYASDPEPANGDSLGTASGQWELRAGKSGFKVEGNSLTTTAGKYAQVGKATASANDPAIYLDPDTSASPWNGTTVLVANANTTVGTLKIYSPGLYFFTVTVGTSIVMPGAGASESLDLGLTTTGGAATITGLPAYFRNARANAGTWDEYQQISWWVEVTTGAWTADIYIHRPSGGGATSASFDGGSVTPILFQRQR